MRTTEFVQVVISDAEIGRMFRRSELAVRILGALTAGDNYISEIARICSSDASNVAVRIRGNSPRYASSMIDLGLIFEYTDRKGKRYYGITARGLEWYRKVKT